MVASEWPVAELIETPRLVLEPLRIDHADEMAPVLDDATLHAFTGGNPATVDQLRERYSRQVAGQSRDGTQGWLNWIMRERDVGEAVGTVQATLHKEDTETQADVAWVVAARHQRRGYAIEAAGAMVGWLRDQGVRVISAYIKPEHQASIGVARRLGLQPTAQMVEGEVRWTAEG